MKKCFWHAKKDLLCVFESGNGVKIRVDLGGRGGAVWSMTDFFGVWYTEDPFWIKWV